MKQPTLTSPENQVTRLQDLVDLSQYKVVASAPAWIRHLSLLSANDGGVLALLGPNGIRASTEDGGRVRAVPDALGVLMAGLSGALRRSSKRLAVGVPPVARHLPLLMASSAVLSDTLEQVPDPSPGRGVLLISPDLDMRSRYCDLFVREVALDSAKPGTRMRPNGERIFLHAQDGKSNGGGVCFFLPLLALPQISGYAPSLIILDLRYGQWVRRAATLAKWASDFAGQAGVLALYTAGDRDSVVELVRLGFLDLPLDHGAVAECAQWLPKAPVPITGNLDWSLSGAPKMLAREHRITTIVQDESFERTLEGLGSLLEECRDQDSLDLRRARWLLATLGQLPVPVDWYERSARDSGRSTLRKLIDRLGTLDRDTPGGAVVGTLRMGFDRMYGFLQLRNPRADALMKLLSGLDAAAFDDLLILVRDRTMERALRGWLALDALANCDWLSRVDVVSCSSYSRIAEHQYSLAVVHGLFPGRYRWIAGAALGQKVNYLAYRHEFRGIERQLTTFYAPESQATHSAQRNAALAGSDARDSISGVTMRGLLPPLVLQVPEPVESKANPPSRTLHTLQDLAKAIEEMNKAAAIPPPPKTLLIWEDDTQDEDPPDDEPLTAEEIPVTDRATCLQFQVESRQHGAGTMWFPTESMVEAVRPGHGDDILLIPARSLHSGDVVICMDSDGRSGLFARVVDLASDQPEMRYLNVLQQRWVEAVDALAHHFTVNGRVVYSAVLRALQENGAKITSQLTVRSWISGQIMGPEDRTSIEAVGKVISSDALVQGTREIDSALRRIRAIRRGLGRRLSSVIRKTFQYSMDGDSHGSDSLLDEHLALPLNELLDSIDFARIDGIASEPVLVPLQWTRRWRAAGHNN